MARVSKRGRDELEAEDDEQEEALELEVDVKPKAKAVKNPIATPTTDSKRPRKAVSAPEAPRRVQPPRNASPTAARSDASIDTFRQHKVREKVGSFSSST